MLKSRLLGSGTACKLLFFICITVFVHLSTQKELYQASNWIELDDSKNVWPKNDSDSVAPFLVFHSEYANNKVLGVKKDSYNENWVTKPDLSFKYFSSAEAYFRSRKTSQTKPEINVKLSSGSWQATSLKSISKEQWENFGFENSDLFTLGLKDFSVKYVEKYIVDAENPDNITAFRAIDKGVELDNFKLGSATTTTTEDNKKISFAGNTAVFDNKLNQFNLQIIKIDLKQAAVTPATPVTIKAETNNCEINPPTMKNIFKKTSCTNGIIEKLKIELDAGNNNFEISKFTGTDKSGKTTTKKLEDLKNTLSLTTPGTFTNTPNAAPKSKYNIIKVNHYDQIKGIIRLNGTNPTGDGDVCYTITKTDPGLIFSPPASFVDVYLTLDKAPVGFKLETLAEKSMQKICIFDYLALQKIDNYIITLVARGDVSEQFSISVEVKSDKKLKKELVAPDNANNDQLGLDDPNWFFYNSIFENTFTSNAQELFACDVISSCYPLEAIEDTNKYGIPEKLKSEMAKSPFFKIRASPSSSVVKFVTTTTEQSKKAFNKQFITENKQSLTAKTIENAEKNLDLTYYLQFTEDAENKATVSVSLDSIDMRFQELIMDVQLVKDETGAKFDNQKDKNSKLFFNSITLKKSEEKEFTYPIDNSEAQISFEKFQGSTNDFFFVRPTKVTTGNSFKFNLQLVSGPVVTKTAPLLVQLKFTVQTITKKMSLEQTNIDKVQDKLFVIHEKNITKTSKGISFKIKPNQSRFIYTNFIENAANTTKMSDLKLSINLTIKSTPGKTHHENYIFYRVILDSDNPKFEQIKTVSGEATNTTVTITDGVNPPISNSEIIKGPFRVVYIIHSQDTTENTVEINSFNVKVVKTTNAKNVGITQSLANVDQNYENYVCVYGNEIKENVCSLKEFYRFSESFCDMKIGCKNFLDQELPTSTLKREDKKFVPFQIALPGNNSKLNNLVIFRQPSSDASKSDFCVPFDYAAKTTPLTVVTDKEELKTISFPVTNEGSKVTKIICASHFTNLLKTVETLNFTFFGANLDVDHHYIVFKDNFADNKPGNVELTTGIYRDNLNLNDQFLDKSHWTQSPPKDKYTNSLIYKIDVSVVTSFKPNTQHDKTPLFYETLRSKWIKVPSENAKLKIGLNYTIKDESEILYFSKAHVISSFGDRQSYNLEDFKQNSLVVQSNAKLGEYYRFEIEVVLNITKINEQGNSLKTFELTINNLSINDPCVNDENEVEKCSSKNNIVNICERGYNETSFRPICRCSKGFTGVICEKKDYCHFAPKTCKKCQNDEVFEGVICECLKEKIWNPLIKECIDPKELICEENKRPQYNRVTKKTDCVCIEDYVPQPLNASTTLKTCVPFNPCIVAHRKLKTVLSSEFVPCSMKNAICEPTGSKNKLTDFQCKCNTGYYNEHDVLNSKAICLPDKCKSCPAGQYCKAVAGGNDYTCTAKFCDIGFTYNDTFLSCQFNGEHFAQAFNCGSKTAELKNGKPVCKCAAGQLLNEQTQRCDKACDEGAKAACLAKGAPTCIWDETPATGARPLCECKKTDIPYAEKDKASDWKCISRCSLLEKPDYSEARCDKSFEHCDESFEKSPPFVSLYPKAKVVKTTVDAVDSPFINSVFVKNVTTVDVDHITKRKGQNEYCACDLGFTWNEKEKKCFPSTVPIHTITGFEFDLIHTSDEHEYTKKVREAFMKLVSGLFSVSLDSLSSPTKCKKATDTTILCSTSFQSNLNDTQIAEKLKAACVPVGDDKSKCYYLVDPLKIVQSFSKIGSFSSDIVTFEDFTFGGTTTDPDVLIHDPKVEPNVITHNYCDKSKNTCAKFAYSICVADEKTNKPFECLCPNEPFFKVNNVEFIPAKKASLRMQTCGIVNLCETNKDQFGCKTDAKCHFQVEFNKDQNKYLGLSYCTCRNSGITLSDRGLSCEKSCDGSCSNNTASCGRDYLNIKKVVCNCKDGFTGTKCEKKAVEAKKEAEASSSKAYLISTIVVSVIAAIALIGLAVLYFKRR